MEVAPQYTQYLPNNMQAQCNIYGFKHHITGTIRAAMVDTISLMRLQFLEMTRISNYGTNIN